MLTLKRQPPKHEGPALVSTYFLDGTAAPYPLSNRSAENYAVFAVYWKRDNGVDVCYYSSGKSAPRRAVVSVLFVFEDARHLHYPVSSLSYRRRARFIWSSERQMHKWSCACCVRIWQAVREAAVCRHVQVPGAGAAGAGSGVHQGRLRQELLELQQPGARAQARRRTCLWGEPVLRGRREVSSAEQSRAALGRFNETLKLVSVKIIIMCDLYGIDGAHTKFMRTILCILANTRFAWHCVQISTELVETVRKRCSFV